MRTSRAVTMLVALAALNGCMRHAAVQRSTVRIDTAVRGDLQLPAGSLKAVVYIERPVLRAPNTEGNLFVLDAGERSATQVAVRFGQIAGNYMEVQRGLRPGDQVILSDMSQFEAYRRIDLH